MIALYDRALEIAPSWRAWVPGPQLYVTTTLLSSLLTMADNASVYDHAVILGGDVALDGAYEP